MLSNNESESTWIEYTPILYPYSSSYFALISTSTAYNNPNPAACRDWLYLIWYFSALIQFNFLEPTLLPIPSHITL